MDFQCLPEPRALTKRRSSSSGFAEAAAFPEPAARLLTAEPELRPPLSLQGGPCTQSWRPLSLTRSERTQPRDSGVRVAGRDAGLPQNALFDPRMRWGSAGGCCWRSAGQPGRYGPREKERGKTGGKMSPPALLLN